MPTTVVITKDGVRYQGQPYYFRPPEGYMSLRCFDEAAQEVVEVMIDFNDMESATALAERVGPDRTEDVDELARARQWMRNARKYGWDAVTTNTPLQAWELPVEGCECSRE